MSAENARTTYIGQFEHERADRIAAALEDAGIVWTSKRAGGLARFFFIGEWGVRIFADPGRIDEVRRIVDRSDTPDSDA